jgi:glutamyl-tRNA(Gln) amidotransferase subunit E
VSSSIDYAEVGLRVGLEVHQQLLTERKMFCKCPAGLYTEEHDGSVLRHMRPTLSELGEYDGTALMEFKTRKNIVYLLNKANMCTYEMDDTPPFLCNPQALDIAIEQCLMLGCDIIDEVHIARKQYLDGSIPTGFQRTAIVGVNGRIPFRGREISVTQVSVEEDSCREVLDKGHLIVWRTDRLGMPLIETVTGPDLRTPEEVEEAILLVGRVCRSTGHVRTGMGASRQDVNVSVRGGKRVEIKGVPKASWARRLVHGEAIRQVNLLKLRDELHARGFKKPEDILVEHREVTGIFRDSPLHFLSESVWEESFRHSRGASLQRGKGEFQLRAVRLPGMGGLLSWPTQPDLTFAHELRGRVRVIAGLDLEPILIHTDHWPDIDVRSKEQRDLKRRMRCGPNDVVVVVWGAEQDTLTAVEEIRLRFADAVLGIPNETRQPFEDGSTNFERILPGPDRMYPDTDSPPQRVTRERVEALEAPLPDPPWIREARYLNAGIPLSTIHYLIRKNGAALVDDLERTTDASLRRLGLFFGERLKGMRRAGIAVDSISRDSWRELFEYFVRVPVIWEVRENLVRWLAKGSEQSLEEFVTGEGYGQAPEGWQTRVKKLARERTPIRPDGTQEQRERCVLGMAMRGLYGRVLATEVAAVIRSELEVSA